MLKEVLERVGRIGRGVSSVNGLSDLQAAKLSQLRSDGYVMFDHLVGTDELHRLQKEYHRRLESEFDVELPCLAQTKIDPVEHKELIANNFLASSSELAAMGLTFDRSDFKSYEQVVEEFAPSTLTVQLPDMPEFYNLWLDDDVISVAQSYLGFTPVLTEAYIRRNFPARHRVMNHSWHRDRNHPTYLLKGFIFLSDCTLKTGPHHYISGSIQDRTLDGRPYYTDQEVEAVYPIGSENHIVSVVKAGTIVLEDTRGLHKAGVPEEGFRDLGFSVFLPPVAFRPMKPQYHIGRETLNELSPAQQKFIPRVNIN